MSKKLFVLFCFLVPLASFAQRGDAKWTLRGYGVYDYHIATGHLGGLAILSDCQLAENFRVTMGVEGVSSKRYALNAQGQVNLVETRNGALYAENRYLYRLFPSLNMQEFTGALSLGYRNRRWNFLFGLCNRYVAEIPQRIHGGEGTLFEPMNVMFLVEGNLFDDSHPWNIGASISNYDDFVIERFTLFFYSLKGYYQINDHLRVTTKAGIHPAGVLNLTSIRDGGFVHVGVSYEF